MMSSKRLHVVAFNVPWPADYGGAIDVYYKLLALRQAGVEIVLHTFHYGRIPAAQLDSICAQVYYYPRRSGWESLSFRFPVMMKSRRAPELLSNLLQDDAPILFEGMHTCYYLSRPELAHRFKLVRMHNLEWDYYRALSRSASGFWQRLFYRREAALLRRSRGLLKNAQVLLSISPADQAYLEQMHPSATYLPAFHGHSAVTSAPGTGTFALYQGNLSVPENEAAVAFLATIPTDISIVVAGKSPSDKVRQALQGLQHITLIADPDASQLRRLMQDAHIQVLPTFQATGIKLKLINALYTGRHVLVNTPMVSGTGLAAACTVADDAPAFAKAMQQLLSVPFTEADHHQRQQLLLHFGDEEKGRRLADMLPG